MEYDSLPPFETPEGLPAPSTYASNQPGASVNEDVDDELLDDDEPYGGEDEPDDDESQDTESEQDGKPAEDDVAALKRELQEAKEALAQVAEAERQAELRSAQEQQAAAEQYWDNALAEANGYFARAEAQIYREVESIKQRYGEEEGENYARTKTRDLFAQYQQYMTDFHAKREAGIWQIVMKAALPGYASDVAEHYGLGREAVQELLNYPPDLIPREAERMRRERDARAAERRKATQLARRAKNLEVGNKNVTPGSGRAVSPDIEPGSDDQYNSIPWTRV